MVDRAGELVPEGIPGELWIGGDTVGRGYLHDPALTAAAFTTSPVPVEGASLVYRTGDRARWLPDGELEFLGRVDHQVKVRGVRIELGEIEAVLREHPAVRNAAVVAIPHSKAGTVLAGFVELQDRASADSAGLRAFLAGRLPNQMIPAHLEVRPVLPLSASGKMDRRILKEWALQERQLEPRPAPSTPRAAHRRAKRFAIGGRYRERVGRDLARLAGREQAR